MKINNIQVLNIWNIFNNKFEKTDNIRVKWTITEIAKDIFDIKSRFDTEKDQIINKYGQENEDGSKSLPLNDERIKELFMCESNVSPISLDELESLNLTLEEIMLLKPILIANKQNIN